MIVRVLDGLGELPQVDAEHVDAEVLARAEAHLIGLATEHSPTQLRRLAARLFEVIAADAAEEIEAKKLAAMEQRAEHAMGVLIRREAGVIEGLTEIRLLVPDGIADRFSTYLEAFTGEATWCEARHHNQPWSQGGQTDLAGGLAVVPLAIPPQPRRPLSPPEDPQRRHPIRPSNLSHGNTHRQVVAGRSLPFHLRQPRRTNRSRKPNSTRPRINSTRLMPAAIQG